MADSKERKQQRRRERAAKDARRRVGPHEGLPMPHDLEVPHAVSLDEAAEFAVRTARHEKKNPDYRAGWCRPSSETALKAVAYLETLPGWPREAFEALHDDEVTRAQLAVVALDHAVQLARYASPTPNDHLARRIRSRSLSITGLANAVARFWSPTFRQMVERGPAASLWQTDSTTLAAVQRDLLVQGVHLEKLWWLVTGPSKRGTVLYSLTGSSRKSGASYSTHLSVALTQPAARPLEKIVQADAVYAPTRVRDTWRLILEDDHGQARGRRHVAGGIEFGKVPVGPRSKAVVAALEASRLRFSALNFMRDYRRARLDAWRLRDDVRAERKRLGYIGGKYPESLRVLVEQRAAALAYVAEYRACYEQIIGMPRAQQRDLIIKTRAFRVSNRRFESTGVWPQRAHGRVDLMEQYDEDIEGTPFSTIGTMWSSPRGRWFDAVNGEELVGLDISSSQTQIVAVLLQHDALERLASGQGQEISMKTHLVEAAWAMRETLLQPGREGVDAYKGADDPRLVEAVKSAWMRILYGSTIANVVRDHGRYPTRYGPGWTSAVQLRDFLLSIDGYAEMFAFREAMRIIGMSADEYQGVAMVDPLDEILYAWDPLRTGGDFVQFADGMKLWHYPPGRMVKLARGKGMKFVPFTEADMRGGRCPVNRKKLRNQVAPCVVHSLDGYFAALVIERLHEAKIESFASIHDAWLVPKSKLETLREILAEAAAEWVRGLGVVYAQITALLEKVDDPKAAAFLVEWRAAHARWSARTKPVAFLAKTADLAVDLGVTGL